MEKKSIGIYVHIPFCKQKCEYCDFTSFADKNKFIEDYSKWLLYEIQQVGKQNEEDYLNEKDAKLQVQTIYIGGGTPSHIDSQKIVEIVNTIKAYYEIDENAEITIEINPGNVTEAKLKEYYQAGINRLSIGLQSTHSELLQTIGRIHSFEEFKKTYQLARKTGFQNINVDLMLALPKQTIEDIEQSIREVIRLEPEHISLYSLILEEGTNLQKRVERQELKLPEEDMERKMYWDAKKILEEAGYEQYEISNFAKQGYYSKHNWDCWSQKEYIGFGVAAHSYTNGIRYSNIDSIEKYIQNYEEGKSEENFIFHEKQTHADKLKEYMLLNLRKLEGIDIQEFKNKFIANPIFVFHKELEKLVEQELIEIDGNYIKLTNKGLDFANLVWEEFV